MVAPQSRLWVQVGKGTEAPCLEKRRTKRCFCGPGEFLLAEHVNVVERQEPSLWDIRMQQCNLGGHFEQAGEALCHGECMWRSPSHTVINDKF